MFRVHAGVVDYAILAVYFVVVLGIGHGGSPARESSDLARRGVASVASSVRLATPSLA